MADVYDYAAARLPEDWKSAIDFFWDGFAKHSDGIDRHYTDGDDSVDPAKTTITLLKALPIELMWEYSPGNVDGHRFAVSSELNAYGHALARAVVNRAPDLPRWSFADARTAEKDPEMARQNIVARTFENDLVISDVTFSEGDSRTIDLVAHAIDSTVDAGAAVAQAEMFLAVWLGEAEERIWLGEFDPEHAVYAKKKLVDRLKSAKPFNVEATGAKLDALIATLRDQAPKEPWSAIDLETAAWSSLSGTPSEDEDHIWREDTIAATSAYPEVTIASLRRDRFRSERFSRQGETFCFLKIDGHEDDPIGRFEGREAVEDALNDRLQSSGLGAAIGGGTGLRYSYIDLALVDLEKSTEAVFTLLRDANLTRRTWLHFNDDGLGEFWQPVWPDAPAPPLAPRH